MRHVPLLSFCALVAISLSAPASAQHRPSPSRRPAPARRRPAPPAPAAARIPPPRAVLGFDPGEDRKLADWPTLVRYYQALAKASDRIRYRDRKSTRLNSSHVSISYA